MIRSGGVAQQAWGRVAASKYYFPAARAGSNLALALNDLIVLKWGVTMSCLVTKLGIEVTTLGAATDFVRMGIYEADVYGDPSSLLIDGGQIGGLDTTGWKETAAFTATLLSANKLYYLALCAQGTVGAQIRKGEASWEPVGIASPSTTNTAVKQTGVSGALPNPIVTNAANGDIPWIGVFVSAIP